MIYKIIPTADFKKFFKKLFKKYPSLKVDLAELSEKLAQDYTCGISLGNSLYKVRIAIQSKNKGKSAGARIIYFFLSEDNEIYLIHIYDKSQYENVPKEKLTKLL